MALTFDEGKIPKYVDPRTVQDGEEQLIKNPKQKFVLTDSTFSSMFREIVKKRINIAICSIKTVNGTTRIFVLLSKSNNWSSGLMVSDR